MPDALFPAPEPREFTLSGLLRVHRYKRGPKPKWSNSVPRATCDECFSLQHENRGLGWPRNPARSKRSLGRDQLLLCGAHAQLWRELDLEDGVS